MASFVTFRNYLRVQVPTYITSLQSKWVSAYGVNPVTIPYERLSSDLQQEFKYTAPLIENFDRQLNHKQPLGADSRELMAKTAYFSRSGHDFHPWAYLKAKNVSSLDIFSTLTNTNPFGMGIGNYRNFNEQELSGEWDKLKSRARHNKDWVFLDYWNGIGLKMSLPSDLQLLPMEEAEKAMVDYKRYDDRNSASFASLLSKLSQPQLDRTRMDTETAVAKGVMKTMTDWDPLKSQL